MKTKPLEKVKKQLIEKGKISKAQLNRIYDNPSSARKSISRLRETMKIEFANDVYSVVKKKK